MRKGITKFLIFALWVDGRRVSIIPNEFLFSFTREHSSYEDASMNAFLRTREMVWFNSILYASYYVLSTISIVTVVSVLRAYRFSYDPAYESLPRCNQIEHMFMLSSRLTEEPKVVGDYSLNSYSSPEMQSQKQVRCKFQKFVYRM